MNILIKLMSIVSLVIAPHISVSSHGAHDENVSQEMNKQQTEVVEGQIKDGVYYLPQGEYAVSWNAKKVGGEHHGVVKISNGKLRVENNKIIEGSIEVDMSTIQVNDIRDKEKNAKLVGHLKSEDFFDVENHQYATLDFRSIDGSGKHQVLMADMTIKGIRNQVRFDVTIEQNSPSSIKAGAYLTIDRTKYDITYKSKSVDALLDEFIYDNFDIKTKFIAELPN